MSFEDDALEIGVLAGAPIAFIVVIALLGMWADSVSCQHQWEHSGFKTQWGPLKGCMISRDGEIYIPADNYRDIK